MAKPFGTAELDRLPDAGQTERLASVDGGVEVFALHVLERVEMAGWRKACLGTGDVEADDAAVAPANRQLGDLQASRCGAHRRADEVDREVRASCAATKAVEHRLGRLVEAQPGFGAQLRCHAHFGVHHPVGGQVLGALVGHAFDGVAVLHHADRVGERFEVQHQIVALRAAVEPRAQFGHVSGRQPGVSVLRSELDHGGGPQPTVEVIVQQHLGQCGQQVAVHAAAATSCTHRSGISAGRCSQFHDG